jgi:DNA transformation protein
MTSNNDFAAYVSDELLREVDGITIRRMFDGHGIYRYGIFVGLINGGVIYLKVDDGNQRDFEERGSKPFVYSNHNGKQTTLSFWELPEEIMDDPQEIVSWITGAYDAALRSKKKKKP